MASFACHAKLELFIRKETYNYSVQIWYGTLQGTIRYLNLIIFLTCYRESDPYQTKHEVPCNSRLGGFNRALAFPIYCVTIIAIYSDDPEDDPIAQRLDTALFAQDAVEGVVLLAYGALEAVAGRLLLAFPHHLTRIESLEFHLGGHCLPGETEKRREKIFLFSSRQRNEDIPLRIHKA